MSSHLIPRTIPLALLLICGICTAQAGEPDTFVIDLEPASWTFAPDTIGTTEGDMLRIAGGAESAWAAPQGRWPSAKQLEFRMKGSAEGGRLIAQAEWFDRSGQLVSAQEIVILSGADIQVQGAPLPVPDGASSFGLKFWMEGTPAKASLAEVRIERVPDWPAAVGQAQRINPDNTKLEVDNGLTVNRSGSSWAMVLAEGTQYAGVHLDSPVEARPGVRVLLPVLETPPGALVSMQILRWGPGRTFLGEVEAIKDVTEAGDYEFVMPESATTEGAVPSEFTTKIWVNAPPGKTVRLGAPVFAGPAATP